MTIKNFGQDFIKIRLENSFVYGEFWSYFGRWGSILAPGVMQLLPHYEIWVSSLHDLLLWADMLLLPRIHDVAFLENLHCKGFRFFAFQLDLIERQTRNDQKPRNWDLFNRYPNKSEFTTHSRWIATNWISRYISILLGYCIFVSSEWVWNILSFSPFNYKYTKPNTKMFSGHLCSLQYYL